MKTKEKATHTPGPWTADPSGYYEPWTIHAAEGVGGEIARVFYLPRPEAERDPLEVEANARLIAASPDLLAALEEMVDWFIPGDNTLDGHIEAAAKAEAAIAKAKGLPQ